MSDIVTFTGFPDATFDFLRDLAANNDRDWFTANRARYESYYLEPALAFIATLGPRLSSLPGDVRYEPRINGSLFRINRDIRFSNDKRPYKDHLDMWFWQGDRKGWETPGYFLRLTADKWAIGAGMHHFAKEQLDLFRAAVIDDVAGATLEDLVAGLRKVYEVGSAERKSVPRGFDAAHPRAAFLLHEGLVAMHTGPVPAEVQSMAFVHLCFNHFEAVSPVNKWLSGALTHTH